MEFTYGFGAAQRLRFLHCLQPARVGGCGVPATKVAVVDDEMMLRPTFNGNAASANS
jgi:hypothetical protein